MISRLARRASLGFLLCGLLGCSAATPETHSATAAESDAPELAEIDAHIDHPDGTFTEQNVAEAVTKLMAVTVRLPSKLDGHLELSCPALDANEAQGTCECSEGGSFEFRVDRQPAESGRIHRTKRRTFSKCVAFGMEADGTFFHHDLADEGTATFNEQSSADVALTLDGRPDAVRQVRRNGNATLEGGTAPLDAAVHLEDGWVALVASEEGTSLRDSAGDWVCEGRGRPTSCTLSGSDPPHVLTIPRW